MALSIGIRSRSILNGTQTVPLQLATDPGITFGLRLGNGAVVCHQSMTPARKIVDSNPEYAPIWLSYAVEAARKRPNKSQKATVNEKTSAKNKARESVK
jgi:hypothetical protein